MGILYIVGAPQGDLDDITLRAVRILGEVTLIVASDVPHTRRLLAHYDIATPLTPLSEPDCSVTLDSILGALEMGDVALVTTAWSPSPSGPSYRLIRAAIGRDFPVVPSPGPTLPITALVVSGLPADSFVYLGQLPTGSSARCDLLASVAAERRTLLTLVLHHQLSAALTDMAEALGERPLAVVATSDQDGQKVWRGTVSGASEHLLGQPDQELCVLVVGGARGRPARWDIDRLRAEVRAGLERGLAAKEIGRQLAVQSDWPRREIYSLAVEIDRLSVDT